MYQNFIIPYLYEAQHVSGDTPPIIRSLNLHWQPLVFHTWKVVRRVVGGHCQAQCAWQCPPTTRPTTFHIWKTRGCQCSFRLLMMGGVSPDTCWASYKYGMINFWYIVASCWIFLYELVSLQYQRMRKCFFSLMIPYAKNIQEIQTNLKQNVLVTMWKWVKLKLLKYDDKRNITFKFLLTHREQFVPLAPINTRQF